MYLNNLQSYLFGLMLILFMGFVACEKSIEELPTSDFNQILKLKKTQEVWIGANQQFKISVEEITDNRCPRFVQCITAGNAVVTLKISDNEDNLVKFELNSGEKSNFRPDSIDFNFKNKAYRVILNDVTPYPELDKKDINKEAVLLIKYKN